ncbi:fimbria/pilus periplasmic chaperone [Vibrio splendidus]|uniref:fimbria/pilus periplasmic chaperone n=1 Tax=Vibrio splendidus TaxID=29497 RepID=UPI0021B268E8|nr:fimbria/pilus periplasmic chaperone [Vibrio splendidus]UWZ99124.1 molecular chaperone [Vibrio splendidus]
MIKLALTILISCFSLISKAYEVSPMYLELEDQGRNSQGSYTIINPEDYPIAVEASVFKMKRDSENVETLTPADKEFLVLPPQAVVKSNQSQLFRVRFIPNQPLDQTATYRVIFTQLELEDELDEESNVTMVIEFATLVFISPTDSTPDASISLNDDNSLVVENNGDRVLNLSTLNFEITGNEQKIITWDSLNQGRYSDYLMPSRSMAYEFPEMLSSVKSIRINN